MDWDADGATLVCDCACYSLADPPRGISTEFMTAAIVEFFSGPDETDITFLDQIEEWNPAPHVFLCDANYQTRIGRNKVFAGRPAIFDEFA